MKQEKDYKILTKYKDSAVVKVGKKYGVVRYPHELEKEYGTITELDFENINDLTKKQAEEYLYNWA